MRLSPNDTTGRKPNPIRRERFLRGLSVKAFAALVGVKPHVIEVIEAGRIMHLKVTLRDGFVAAGLDFDALAAEYATWRDGPLTLPGSPDLPVGDVSPDEQAILDAIKSGVRGVRNIAGRSGVPYDVVQQFLRQGRV